MLYYLCFPSALGEVNHFHLQIIKIKPKAKENKTLRRERLLFCIAGFLLLTVFVRDPEKEGMLCPLWRKNQVCEGDHSKIAGDV